MKTQPLLCWAPRASGDLASSPSAHPPTGPGEAHLPSPGFTLTRSIASRAWAMRVLGGGFRSDTSWVEPKYLAPNMTPSRRSSWSQGPGTEGNSGGRSAPASPQPRLSNPTGAALGLGSLRGLEAQSSTPWFSPPEPHASTHCSRTISSSGARHLETSCLSTASSDSDSVHGAVSRVLPESRTEARSQKYSSTRAPPPWLSRILSSS